MEEVKYYTGSDGIPKDISTLHSTHLINGLSKKYIALFESATKDEFAQRLQEINNMKEEIHKRINDFYGTINN